MKAYGYRERQIYSRQGPSQPMSNVNEVRRYRRSCCCRFMTSIQSLFFIVFLSFTFIGYWIGQTTYMTEAWMGKPIMPPVRIRRPTTAARMQQGVEESGPSNELDVDDVIDPTSIQSLNSSRLAFYVFCGERNSIEYAQYLSLASVTRFFNPTHLVFLYETETPTLAPGSWTTATGMDDLLERCTARLVAHRMSNTTLLCRDTIKMREFIMKLLFRFGGLYVGRRTVMTEMAIFMRPTIIDDHLLSHLEEDLEGFMYAKKPLAANERTEDQRETALRVPPYGRSPPPPPRSSHERPHNINYITSRQLSCEEALRAREGEVHYACLIIRETLPADPLKVVQMRSAFGTSMRKAIFNISDEQQMQNYTTSTNTSATPPLCSDFL